MGRKNGGLLPEEQNGASTSANNALVFITMSIIGFPVDVHVKDGSIYSGTFHTASIDDAYGIVLKKARMIKKGNRQTNLADGSLIETLIILSEDLVQVVAKELMLPAEGISGKVGAAYVVATAGTLPQNVREEREANVTNSKEPNLDRKHDTHARFVRPYKNSFQNGSVHNNSVPIANGKSDCRNLVKGGEAFTVSPNMRQVGDSSEEKRSDLVQEQVLHGEETTDQVEGSRSSLDAHSKDMNAGTNKGESPNLMSFERSTVAKLDDPSNLRHTLDKAQETTALSSKVCADASSGFGVASDCNLSLSSASTKVVLPKVANHGLTTKESKLNPRAKLFSPSPLQHRSATPPAVPSRTPEPPPTVVGHVGSRTPPVRYANQYNHLQAGTTYLHQNSQNMTGRAGPLFYALPVSNDATQGVAGYSQLSSHPLLMPHQANLPKNQGIATMQALQLYVTPFLANGQQPYAVPSYIPISPPFFPSMGSIPVPGSDGSLSAKFVCQS
ncbi:uncharacterized protein [Coffea arabica]|uniref:Uncharacterized protein isoform X2 n=1 Tax=Coffea arabica TaxID=13443 RepID=A0A6P6SEJ4_COFAR|nr:uncharacterized protein LOC113690496 isoform X2 [Coffea arabica]